jgi:hypothetical protein
MRLSGSLLTALTARLERPLHLAVGLAFRQVAPLVALLLTPRQRELDLHPPVLEVELRRDEREPALRDLSGERGDLLSVQEELSVAIRIVVGQVPLLVNRDVRTDEPRLLPTHVRIGLLQGSPSVAKRLDLGPGEDHTGLDPVEEVVVVPRAAVVDDQVFATPSQTASVDRASLFLRSKKSDLHSCFRRSRERGRKTVWSQGSRSPDT